MFELWSLSFQDSIQDISDRYIKHLLSDMDGVNIFGLKQISPLEKLKTLTLGKNKLYYAYISAFYFTYATI